MVFSNIQTAEIAFLMCVFAGFAGTPGYLSPEVLRKEAYGKPVDIWACGESHAPSRLSSLHLFLSSFSLALSLDAPHIFRHISSQMWRALLRQVLSRGCCQAPLSPSCFTATFSRVSLVERFNYFVDQ